MMQNGCINSPRLDQACPQAKADIDNHVHMFRQREVSVKTKYEHSRIVIIIIIAINFLRDPPIEYQTYDTSEFCTRSAR